jgi:hypothetical protein
LVMLVTFHFGCKYRNRGRLQNLLAISELLWR